MGTLKIYTLNNFHIYTTYSSIILIMLYILSLVLIYLLTESFYLLTFIQSLSYPPPTSSNQTFDLFFYESVFEV